jgi:RecA-family ATPase
MLLREMPADMVIIDTFSDVYDGDMNQANKVRSYIQKFKEIANRHKTLIVFNHHCGKKNDFRPPHKDNLLGSQGFESCMRTVIELRKDFGDTTKRHMCIVKGNYIPESFKNSSYKLEFSFDQGFMYTGERVTFEKLIKVTSGEKDGLQERVLLLKKEGLSYSKIAEKLTSEGHKISKSKVGNICKNYRPAIQEPIDDEMDGQEAA